MEKPILYVVVPCYNEELVLPEASKRLKEKLTELIKNHKIHQNSKILFINDGSKDTTWELIKNLCCSDGLFCGISLSKNKGHQNALLAGLLKAKDLADIAISIDADLQDDVNAIDDMLKAYKQGYEIVYGVRSKRKTDSIFKRKTAQGFYKLLKMLGVDIVYNHADYRLMSQRALKTLAEFREVNLFLRGIVPMLGYKTTTVEYERHNRFAGETKYPLKKMLSFAIEGITSLSIRPIRLISMVGLLAFLGSLVMLVFILVDYFGGGTATGWASIVFSIWAIGGLQLLAIGIIGEYIGKIYLEAKARPRYIIEEEVFGDEDNI